MKKLYIPIISIIFCTQHIQSMKTEVNTPYSNDEGYQIILKDLDDLPKPIPILREPNALSDKLYAKNITDTEIRQLVSQGAKLNYINRQYSNCPIPIHYVFNGTAQGLKNMETIIELGAAIHDLEDEEHTPLTIALLQQDPIFKYKKMDFTDMILLLMPHENPTVTIYEHNYYDDGKLYKRRLDTHEKRIREYLINSLFDYQNIPAIKLLLKLKLMTANRGLKEFAHYMKPNQEILNLLSESDAQYNDDIFNQMMRHAFPFDTYIDFIEQACIRGAYNAAALERLLSIKTKIDLSIKFLESNAPQK